MTDWIKRLERNLARRANGEPRSIFREINPQLVGDRKFESRWRTTRQEAAVLVPIVDRTDGPTVLLTVRSPDMPSHAGQISFPGGKVQPEDIDRAATALREAEEEVNIRRADVRVLGALETHEGGLGFAVTPVVGLVDPAAPFSPCPREVAEIFEAPLAWIAALENHTIEDREHEGVRYRMFAAPFGPYHIWGLTAGILRSLADTLNADFDR